jgi:hypothetical protein
LKRVACVVVVAIAASSFGCDKLGLGKKSDGDGGTVASSGGGGGILSFLDKTFEGEITMVATGKETKNVPKTFMFGLKTPKIRIDAARDVAPDNPMTKDGVIIIFDPPAKKAWALLPPKKQAILIDLNQAKNMKATRANGPFAPSTTPAVPPEPPKIEKTGKKDSVAGYECEIWKITQKDGKHAEACLAEGIKWMDLTDIGMQSPEIAMTAALSDMNHFPLRLIAWDAANVEQSRFEATKIEKKKLDDSRFTVPPDYQVIDMATMMGALANPTGGRPGLPPGFAPPKRPGQ